MCWDALPFPATRKGRFYYRELFLRKSATKNATNAWWIRLPTKGFNLTFLSYVVATQIWFHFHPENWGNKNPNWRLRIFLKKWVVNTHQPVTSTWRIIPVSKWLITMVSKSPKDGVVPLANGRTLWLINGGDPNHLLTGMILQVRVCRKKPQSAWPSPRP